MVSGHENPPKISEHAFNFVEYLKLFKRVRDFSTHSSAVLADFLWSKGRIAMGRMNEGTLIFDTIGRTASRSSQTFYTKKDEKKG